MFDDFDLIIQPEELFDEDEISLADILMEEEAGDEDVEYTIEIEEVSDLEELFATQILENIADDLEDLDEEDYIPDDIDWIYELETTYGLENDDFEAISRDFFDMLNED